MELTATNRDELLKKLSLIDISVPLRSQGRTTEQCERWSIAYWLTTYPSLEFPIKIIHCDKPDFQLETNGLKIGIEHTEAINQNYAHASAISEQAKDQSVVDMSLFSWGEKKNPQEINEIAKRTKLTGLGWDGDSPEKQWAFALSEIIDRKTNKLRKDDFKKFPNNFLLIYDNLPLPAIDYSKGLIYLREALKAYWVQRIIFDTIFLQTDALLMVICHNRENAFKNMNIW